MLNFILFAATAVFVLRMLYLNNMLGMGRGTKKAKVDVSKEKKLQKKKEQSIRFNRQMTKISKNFGRGLSPYESERYQRYIIRLKLKNKLLQRNMKPEELHGLLRCIQLVGLSLMLLVFALTLSPFALVFGIFIFSTKLFKFYAEMKISEEDADLQRDFPEFFLVLYNRLIQGPQARLEPTLNGYLVTLDAMPGTENVAIRRFITDIKGFIDLHGNDLYAIREIRKQYTSDMIVNFCNLAVQALNGVDNKDKLFAFKMELNARRLEAMTKRADQLVARGSRRVNLIYLILAQFVILSWVAKLGGSVGGLGSILGF